MATKTMKLWTDEQDGLVKEIIDSYTHDGRVRWAKAFNEHPDWAKSLTKGRTLAAVMTRGNDIVRGKKAKRFQVPDAKPAKGGKRPSWAEDQRQVIRSIIDGYSTGTLSKGMTVDYAGAFAEHPEWRDLLSGKSAQAIYAMGKSVMEKNAAAAKNGETQGRVDNSAVDTAEPAVKAVKPIFAVNGCPNCLLPLKPMNDGYANLGPLPFCPRCTCPLGVVRTSLRILDKVSHRNGVA